MKGSILLTWSRNALLIILLAVLASGCAPGWWMMMNPTADSDKPSPVPANDNSCWLHTASNVLAAAGYGTGTTVQARADDIWADMNAQYGTANGGWTDAALSWWLGSANNTWSGTNAYTVVTVYGNKPVLVGANWVSYPWANANGARDLGNELRSMDPVGLSLSVPTGSGGTGGHAITAWGDNVNLATLTTNPTGLRVTDSDDTAAGAYRDYTYDAYTSPNPGGSNDGNGWYFNYAATHWFIKHIAVLSRTTSPSGPHSTRVLGAFRIQQTSDQPASDLHYRVGTDIDILTYRTTLDWTGTPAITEASPRRSLTVDWTFTDKPVPQGTWVTITTEFVETFHNAISYSDVHFTYANGKGDNFANLAWNMDTPVIEKAEQIPNVTGGYVIGSFDVNDPQRPDQPLFRYRFVHQYLYNQNPEAHTFQLSGPPGYTVTNVLFGHSYGYPTQDELWGFENWMTRDDNTYELSDKPVQIEIDWKGRLPYPPGDE